MSFGQNWISVDNSQLPAGDYNACAVSESGQYQLVTKNAAGIYYSSNYGQTWAQTQSDKSFVSMAVSASGQYAVTNATKGSNLIYTSSNYGQTWASTQIAAPVTQSYPIIYPNSGADAKTISGDNDGAPWAWGGGQYDYAPNLQAAIEYVKSVSPNAVCALWSGSPTSGGGRINWYNTFTAPGRGTLQLVNGQSWVAIQFVEGLPGAPSATVDTTTPVTACTEMSASGQYMTSIIGSGNIYVSANYGSSWTVVDLNKDWLSVAMSASGQYQIASTLNDIYYSSNYGQSWTKGESVPGQNLKLCMSESGQYACVTTYSGAGVYYSSNYGQTWSASSGITNAFAIAISASGKNVIAGAINQNPNSIYYSTNYGVSWNLVSSTLVSGSAKINGMSMSYNGQYLLAVTEGGANVLTIAPKRYTTTDVTVSRTGIVVDYIDNTGSTATQTLSVANKTLSIDNGLNVISGDTTLSGALVAAGASNLQGAVQLDSTLSVASNSALGGSLTVVGAVNMNNTLNVSGASALNSLGVSGGLTSNTVDVSGTSRLRNTLQVDGAATINSLTVAGASALNSTLAVAGNSALGGTLNVAGASNLASSLVVAGASSLGGSLDVTGATTLGNSLAVTGATTINGVTTINNNVVVNGGSSYSAGGSIYGDYIQVQLSSATPIDSYTIGISSEAAGFVRNPTRYSLVGSNDGITWFSIDNPSSNVDYIVNGSQKSCTRSVSGNYSYYRFIIRSLADTQYWYFFMNYFGLSYNGTSLFNAANPLTGINGNVITNGSLVGTVSYSWYGSRNFDNNTPSNLGRILGNPTADYNVFVIWWGVSTNPQLAYLQLLYPGGTAGSSAPSTSYTSVTLGSGTFTVNSNSAINAPLTVAGAAQMNSSLGVTGVATMNNDANVGRNLNVSGAAIVTGTTALVGATTVTGAASLGSTLSVAGNSTLSGTLSVAGNSAVGGTLDVTGTSNLNGTMNVQGASRLYNVVQVDGAATLGSSLTVAGVATMNNGATINGTSALNGALTVAGGATLQSSLGVTGAATLSSTLAVTGATTLSNVTVSGDESVAGSLTVVSATALQNTLDVQGASHLYSSAQVDGAVTLGSSLTVAGATTMNGATVNGTVTVTGSTALQSSLDVTGAATLGSTLAVAGATTLTGPSQINNSLGVTGAATLGSVTVSGASQMNSTLAVNGAATLGGTMTVAGATQVNNTLGVTGSAIIGGAMVIAGATQVNNTLGVQGNSTLAGELNVSGIAQLNNALNVTGTTVLSGTLGVIGASTFDDAVDIEGATTLNGATTVNDNMTVNGKVTYTTANVYGESIQFNLSSVAPIDSYSVGTTESAPVLFALVGSDDNVEWFVIDQPTSIVYSSNVCTRSVTASYMYYRLVLSKISGTSVSVNYVGLSYQGTPLFTASNLSPPTDVVTTYSTVTAVTPGDRPNIGGLKSSTSDVYGNLYVMTSRTGIIQVTPNGASSSIAYYGDSWGGGLACDGTDYVYIADSNNRRIIQYDIDTGAPAFFATPNGVSSITVDSDGYVYFDNGGNYPPSNTIITKLDPSTGAMTILYTISAFTSIAAGIAVDSSGNVYYTDTTANTIIRVTQGVATTIAGTGSAGSANGVGTAASFSFKPVSYGNNNNIAYYNGSLYIADTYNNRIRKLNLSTMAVTTVAGGSQSGFVNGNGTSALFLNPVGISLDSNGNIYVCDQNDSSGVGGYIVRMIDSVDSNTITNGGLSVTCNLSFASDSNMTVRNTNSVNLLVNSGLTSTIAKVGWSGSAGQQAYISNRYPSGIAGSSAPTTSIITDSQITGSFTVNTQSAINSTLAVSGATTLGSSVAVTGASTLGSTLAVTGASTLGSSLTVAGASQLNNSLAVSGAASLNSTLAVQGNSTFQNNVTVHGNLTVLGGQTSVNTVSMEVKDNAILIADNNTADVLESGLQIQYKPVGASAPLYAGIKRIPVTGQFALFKDATSKISETEPSTGTDIYAGIIADSFACASDMNLKKNIVNLDGALDKLDNIRGVYHDWIDENQSKDRQIGVIAQEVEAIYPELVTKGENGYLSVNYPKLTAVLIQAVKELKAIVCGSGHTQTASKKRKQMSSETRKLK